MPDGPRPRLSAAALSSETAALRAERRRGIVHLGLGAFHRSHQAWFTDRAQEPTGERPWGIVAFTGRRPDAATALSEQDCVYTLLSRSASGDEATLVSSILAALDGGDADKWRAALASPDTAVVTLTVTEAAYRRAPDGGVDPSTPDVAADVRSLRASGPAITVPGRLVDGLRARRDAGAGPLAVVSCDNLTGNGDIARDVVLSLAATVDGSLADWILGHVSFVSSMVDRITPATTDADRADAARLTGYDDYSVVVAEPFAEWVVSTRTIPGGPAEAFPAGRPSWETAGVRFIPDLEPYEHRKLWLLNAGHSLLAYLGLLLGHETIDEAMADERCTEPLEQLWSEAADVLPLPADEIEAALASLRERFRNPRIRHRLRQIGADGSVKLPVRVVAPLRARLARAGEQTAGENTAGEKTAGEKTAGARSAGAGAGDSSPGIGPGATTALASWHLHLVRQPELVSDTGAAGLGAAPTVTDVVALLAPDLATDPEVVAAVEAAEDRILSLIPSPDTQQGVPA